MALAIAIDGKSRLSVCNALDKVLIHEELPDLEAKTQRLINAFRGQNIEVFGDDRVSSLDKAVSPITDDNIWHEEFLSANIVIGSIKNLSQAIEMINKYSGGHSAGIVTANADAAEQFLSEVDCAAVYHNASVRFTDGGEFGLGAEIAISTQKLHFRGPLGIEHLLTNKWFVFGDGQVRN